ncbi:hypothetical protein ACFQ7F_24660 [Streptomyces sp. NPDC056486]|uniref:hypothetical protein n=1 Tax=Streptomyces sp. NPDC056486 TaxID=3345835 RepID=UPI00368AB5AE
MGWVEWLVFGVVCAAAGAMLLGTIGMFATGHPAAPLLALLTLGAGGWLVSQDWPLTWQEAALSGVWPVAAFFAMCSALPDGETTVGVAIAFLMLAVLMGGAYFVVPHYVEGAKGPQEQRPVASQQPAPSSKPPPSKSPRPTQSRTPSESPRPSNSSPPNSSDSPGTSSSEGHEPSSTATGKSFPEQWGPWMAFVGGGTTIVLACFQIHEIADRRRERRTKGRGPT